MKEKNKLLSTILTLILLVITISIMIINIKLYQKIRNKQKYLKTQIELEQQIQENTAKYYEKSALKEISNMSTFYKVKSCTEAYFSTLHYLWYNDNINVEEKNYQNIDYSDFEFSNSVGLKLLNILAKEYKNETKLTMENLQEKYNTYFKQDKTIISMVYQYDIKEGISMYLVNGYNFCKDGSNKTEFQIMIIIDENQDTFEIYPEEYVRNHQIDKIEIDNKVSQLDDIVEVEKNEYNTIKNEVVTNEKVANYYFNLYKFNLKHNVDAAYNMLDKEYKEKRFGNLENYKNYININYNKLISPMDKYKVKKDKDYNQYICVDKNGYYYIFNTQKCLEYNLSLDTYTLDLPEFTEKYYKAEDAEKVALNIQKIVEAMKEKDYNYMYSKLADGFKEKYFTTLDSFEKYAEENFFDDTEVEYLYYKKESEEYYSYTLKFSDRNTGKTKNLKIIMELQSGTNFVYSFNV